MPKRTRLFNELAQAFEELTQWKEGKSDLKVMLQARELVHSKRVKSSNALVETALRHEIKTIRAADIKAAMLEAATDPLFLADLEETTAAFRWIDGEGEGDTP